MKAEIRTTNLVLEEKRTGHLGATDLTPWKHDTRYYIKGREVSLDEFNNAFELPPGLVPLTLPEENPMKTITINQTVEVRQLEPDETIRPGDIHVSLGHTAYQIANGLFGKKVSDTSLTWYRPVHRTTMRPPQPALFSCRKLDPEERIHEGDYLANGEEVPAAYVGRVVGTLDVFTRLS